MADKKSNNTKVMAIIGAVFVVMVILMLIAAPPAPPPAEGETATESAETPADASSSTATDATLDINEALSDRIIGDTNAPLKVVEFASLTCSHCADFHKETLDQFKTNYIDTGKAYLIFSEFPLNGPAMEATKIARCLPKDKYFDFTHMLFKEQETWVQLPDYKGWLKTKAGEFGMSPEKFDACLANKELEDGIADRMKVAQERWKITATPSFVFNDDTVISGSYPYDAFETLVKQELDKATGVAPAPAQNSTGANAVPVTPESVPPGDQPAETPPSESEAAPAEPPKEE